MWRPDTTSPAAVVEARPHDNRIELTAAAKWRGTTTGAASEGTVYAGVRRSGRLEMNAGSLPRGAEAVVLGMAPGCAPRWQTMRALEDTAHFRVRLARGVDVSVVVKDPEGRPVPGVVVRRAGTPDIADVLTKFETDTDGRAVLRHQSDGDRITVHAEAPGFSPVDAGAWPGLENEIILWPDREVEVTVWDAWNQRGVDNAAFTIQLDERATNGNWFGSQLGSTERPIPVRPGSSLGQFHVRLPRARVELNAGATGYGSSDTLVAAAAVRVRMRLTPPRRRHRVSHLVLKAPGHKGTLPLVVKADNGKWGRFARLVDGRARIAVRPNLKLMIASTRAADGVWLPQTGIDPIQPRKERELVLGVRPAIRLTIRTDPKVDGEMRLFDLAYDGADNEMTRSLVNGEAIFHVRPQRDVAVQIRPVGNVHGQNIEFMTEHEDHVHAITLDQAAGFETTVFDHDDHPVSFARVRVWEPTLDGRLALRGATKTFYADAEGHVRVVGLREGDLAFEVEGPYATTWRSGVIRIRRRRVITLPPVKLYPTAHWTGRFRTADGKPQAGLKLVALRPEIFRLKFANGGERELFNVTSATLPTACSDREGGSKSAIPGSRKPMRPPPSAAARACCS